MLTNHVIIISLYICVSNHDITYLTVLHVNCISIKLEKWKKKRKKLIACLRMALPLLPDTSLTGSMNYKRGSRTLVWPAQPWLLASGRCSSPTLPPILSVPCSGNHLHTTVASSAPLYTLFPFSKTPQWTLLTSYLASTIDQPVKKVSILQTLYLSYNFHSPVIYILSVLFYRWGNSQSGQGICPRSHKLVSLDLNL